MKAELRAGLIALVLLSQAIAAIPNPPSLKEDALTDPTATAELDAWAETLSALGYQTDREGVFALAQTWNERLKGARKALIAPFSPALKLTGTGQGWGLFAFPDVQPYRFEIAVLEGEEYRDIYVDLDPERDAYARLLAYRRVRAIYNPGKSPAPAFKPFADWLAKDVLERHPEVERVRVGFRRSLRLEPFEPHPGWSKKLRFMRVYRRDRL